MYEACRNEWEDAPDLSETRVGAVGVVTSDDEYWILGGENEDGESLDSSQIWRIGMRQWESGPSRDTSFTKITRKLCNLFRTH